MSTHANMVKMTVTSVGADPYTITLNAASSGFQSFADAYGANATVDILITQGTVWEVARDCTYTHSGTTVTRGTFEDSSTGSRITTFDNTATVSVVATANVFNATENFLGAWGALSGENSITAAATAVIGRLNVCSGTSANYSVMLPAVSGNTGKYIGFRMAFGLTKLVCLTTGADAVTKTGTVTGSTTTMTAGAGTVSTSGSSTTLTGSGTAFDTALRVGDALYITGQTSVVYVAAIASATSLTMSEARTVSASTAWGYVKTGIAGSSTLFTTEYTVGDGITVGSDTREIVYIASNTALGLDRPFITAPSGSAHGRTTTTIDGEYNRVMWANEAALLYCDGSTWTKMAGKSIPMTCGMYKASDQTVAASSNVRIDLDSTISGDDNTGLMADATNKRINIVRSGNYMVSGVISYDPLTGRSDCRLHKNTTTAVVSITYNSANAAQPIASTKLQLIDTDGVQLYASQFSGGSEIVYGGAANTQLYVTEVPKW